MNEASGRQPHRREQTEDTRQADRIAAAQYVQKLKDIRNIENARNAEESHSYRTRESERSWGREHIGMLCLAHTDPIASEDNSRERGRNSEKVDPRMDIQTPEAKFILCGNELEGSEQHR